MRALGKMKRMAWSIEPAAISSALKSSDAMGKPAASADVHWSPRSDSPYAWSRSHTTRHVLWTVEPSNSVTNVSHSRLASVSCTSTWQSLVQLAG